MISFMQRILKGMELSCSMKMRLGTEIEGCRISDAPI
jgi:hypothetical protein